MQSTPESDKHNAFRLTSRSHYAAQTISALFAAYLFLHSNILFVQIIGAILLILGCVYAIRWIADARKKKESDVIDEETNKVLLGIQKEAVEEFLAKSQDKKGV